MHSEQKSRFRPVLTGPAHRWTILPFDLRIEGKWTHQPGSTVKMNEEEVLSVTVNERQEIPNGIRISMVPEWIDLAVGKNIKITFTTRCETECPYKLIYIPMGMTHSGYYNSIAKPKASGFSFEYHVNEAANSTQHFIVLEPLLDNTPIEIIDASIRIL